MTDMHDDNAIRRSFRLGLLGLAGLGAALVGNGCSALLSFEQCMIDSDCSGFGDGYSCEDGRCVSDSQGSVGEGETVGDGDGDGDPSGDGDGDLSGDGDGDLSGDGDGDGDLSGDGDGDLSGDGDGDLSGDGDGDLSGDGDGDPTGDGDGDIVPVDMIDDFEDGNGALIPADGRQGFWYVFNDGSVGSSQTPAADMVLPELGGASGTNRAMHTNGTGFTEWGAGLGIDFKNMGGNNAMKMAYDASGYTGIVLMAKGNGPVRASVQIEATTPEGEGGTCVSDCDLHGMLLNLTEQWQQFVLPFDQLNQEGWGTPAAWDAMTTTGLQFRVNANVDFDFWVDEIGFY